MSPARTRHAHHRPRPERRAPLNDEHEEISMRSTRTRSTRLRAAVGLATVGLFAAGLTACSGGGGTGGPGGAASIGAEGTDDGTKLTLWTRAPLEKQANLLVDAYNDSHDNQVQL